MTFKDEIRRIRSDIKRVQIRKADNLIAVLVSEDPVFMAMPEHMRTILEAAPGLYLFAADLWFETNRDVIDTIKQADCDCFGLVEGHAYVEAEVVRRAFGHEKTAMSNLRYFEEMAENNQYEPPARIH
jgi:hypothetical protein